MVIIILDFSIGSCGASLFFDYLFIFLRAIYRVFLALVFVFVCEYGSDCLTKSRGQYATPFMFVPFFFVMVLR